MITFQLRLDHQPRSAWIRRFDSFDRFDDHWRSTLATPLLVRWSYPDSAIVTDYSERLRCSKGPTWSTLRCHASSAPQQSHKFVQYFIGLTDVPSRNLSKLYFLAYWTTKGSASLLSLDISPDELNREAFPSSFGSCLCSTYMVRNCQPVDLHDPGLSLSFRKNLQNCFFCVFQTLFL